MRLIIFYILMSFASVVAAQSKPAYTASLGIEWLHGNSGSSSALMFSNGIRYKTVSAGIGAGIDNYVFRSVPLFLTIQKDFGQHQFQPFLEGSAGVNIHAVKDDQKDNLWWYSDAKFRNGLFAKVSAGVSVKIAPAVQVFVSGGYCYKTIQIRHTDYVYDPVIMTVVNTDSYRLNRWCLTAGFRF